jgi:glycosyltransferase involved in cell wall biosynthesis
MAALQRLIGPYQANAMEIAGRTNDYAWNRERPGLSLTTLCKSVAAERAPFSAVFFRTRQKLAQLRIEVCLLPSYFPKQSLAALMAAKSLGLKTVMMNESHAGTARARGVSAFVKRRLVSLFDAGLVGGQPQKRYFVSMGLPPDKVFTGYDAVDNDLFSSKANEVRSSREVISNQYDLPPHYFLSLGRFVAKKNLHTLVHAYRTYLEASSLKRTHLVMVGAGEEERRLKSLCRELELPVYEKEQTGAQRAELHRPRNEIADRKPQTAKKVPGVHFYGFRQIDENPIFYGLADAFILPSLYEEWGLVVNEAMASGLPVVVSEKAGCVEDLLEPGYPTVKDGNVSELLRRMDQSKVRMRKNGFVFNPQSPDELAGALLAIESMPELQSAMGDAARQIVEKFSCENFARNALLAARAALGKRSVEEVEAVPTPTEADIGSR